MKIKDSNQIQKAENCVSTKIKKNSVLLNLETGKYIKLNETATFIWEQINASIVVEQIKNSLAKEFNVSVKVISSDVDDFLAEAYEKKIIQIKC